MTRILLIALSISLSIPALRAGVLRHVPGDYPVIQAAIDASASGDTVLVGPGTYPENLNFAGKNILLSSFFLFSEDTAAIRSTIIDGGHPVHSDTGSCVLFIHGETPDAVLQGFTLTGGIGTRWPDGHTGGFYREGGGILMENSSPTIVHNRIVGNRANDRNNVISAGGGGIRFDGGNPLIANNVISNNDGRYGGGIVLNYTGGILRNNVIANNTGGQDYGGSGVWVNRNGPFPKIVENNTIVNNTSTLDGGGVLVWATSLTLHNNIIWGNTAPTGPQIRLRTTATASVTYCDVQGGWTGIGNINQDPGFACLGYFLLDGSPCIDAGDDIFVILPDPAGVENPDSAQWPSRGTTRNDMGAYGGPDRGLLSLNTNFAPPELVSPPISAGYIPSSTTLVWHQSVCAAPFQLQVSTDPTFAAGIVDSTLGDTSAAIIGLQEFTTYYWRARSVQSIYPNGWSSVGNFTVGAYAFKANVINGWNMISLPIAVNDSTVSVVFPNAMSKAFAYVAGSGYEQQDTLRKGAGYWLKFPENAEVVSNGLPNVSDTIDVSAGWNMIGSLSARVSTASITSDPPGIILSRFWTYEHAYVTVDNIDPFGGYWVKTSQSGKLILTASLSSQTGSSRMMTAPTDEQPPPPPEGEKAAMFVPREYSMNQNYPNPFNPTTTVSFVIGSRFAGSFVTLKVYNILGQEVAELIHHEWMEAGEREVVIDATKLASGLYVYRITAENAKGGRILYSSVRKMMLLK